MNFDEEQRTTECNGKTADFYAFIENLNVEKMYRKFRNIYIIQSIIFK